MRLELSYLLNGRIVSTSTSNAYFTVTQTVEGRRTVVKVKAIEDTILTGAFIDINREFNKFDTFFCNGYQTWTDTKEFNFDDKMNNLKQVPGMVQKMYSFKNYGDISFYEYKKNVLHGHDIAYIRSSDQENPDIFIGNNNVDYAGLIIEFHLSKNVIRVNSDINSIRIKQGKEITVFDFDLQTFKDFKDISYFNKFPKRDASKLVGFSTWYVHHDNICAEVLKKDIDSLDERIKLFQIDDGYQTKVGDWMDIDKTKFPNGLEKAVRRIHKRGVMAGLWIAPFIVAEGSKILQDHPDWLKQEDGKPFRCGSNWGGFYALDFYKNEVRDYIRECLKYYSDMGFDFFKLDFLYAVSLPLYGGKNRSEIASEAYKFLRSCLPDKILMGNGALMAPSFGVFDYMRVGPDVSSEWDDVFYMRHMHRERVSTKICIQNTIYRSVFNNRVFLNDPSVFLLSDSTNKMNNDQRLSLSIINALFGSILMTSETVSEYTPSQKQAFDGMLNLFYNASDATFRKKDDKILIAYRLGGKIFGYVYDPESGVMKVSQEALKLLK